MNGSDKSRIIANYEDLVDNVRPRDISASLVQDRMLLLHEQEEVENRATQKSNRAGMDKLIRFLMKRESFDALCRALFEDYDYLAKQLQETQADSSIGINETGDNDESQKIAFLQAQLYSTTQTIIQFQKDMQACQTKIQERDLQNAAIQEKLQELQRDQAQGQLENYLKDLVGTNNHPNKSAIDNPDGSSVDIRPRLRRNSLGDPTDLLKCLTQLIARDAVQYMAAGKNSAHAANPYAIAMRKIVQEVTKSRQHDFQTCLFKLKIDEVHGFDTLWSVAENLFSDESYNWGRIIVLIAFGGYIAKFSKDENGKMAEIIGDFLGFYIVEQLSTWIEEKGGWDDFLQYTSSKEKPQSYASILAPVIGIAAVAGTVIVLQKNL